MNNDDNRNVNESDSLPRNNSALFDYVCTIYTYSMTPSSADVTEPLTFYNMDDGSQITVLDMGMAITPPTSVSTNEENINPITSQNLDEIPHENSFQVTSVSEPPNPDFPHDHAEFEVDLVSVSSSDFDENEMLIDIADSDDNEMVIDLSDSDFDDDINTDSRGLEIDPERRNNENKFSIDMKRVIQEIEEAKKKLRDELTVLASKLANIQSDNKAFREEFDKLKKYFELQMKNLWDTHLMDCTLSELTEIFDRNSFNLEMQALMEELNNQEALLNATITTIEKNRANRNLEATNSDGTGTSTENATRSSMSLSFSGFNIAQLADSGHLIPINNVGQIVENVIPYPQPQQSQMPLPIFFRVFGNISNHQDDQEAWRPIPIPMQIQQPVSTTLSSPAFIYETEGLSLLRTSGSKIIPEGKKGGKARRKSAGNKENRVTCSNCHKVLDKYYLNKVNGHKKYCKPIGPLPTV